MDLATRGGMVSRPPIALALFMALLTSIVAAAPAVSPAAAAPARAPTARPGQAEDLLAMKATFSNGEELLSTWVAGTDCCAWTGVSCNRTGYVQRIALDTLGLVGTIPQPSGWALPSGLEILELGINNISGPIPPAWALPPGLVTLYFSQNPLGGQLSADWALPPALQHLLLDGCGLAGPLPANWSPPATLSSLALSGNALTGTIPDSFTDLPGMQVMGLSNNSLTGTVPAAFTFNTSLALYGLTIDGNNFTGPVPEWSNAPAAALQIRPGNPLLCGPVPDSPKLITKDGMTGTNLITSLPACPPDDQALDDATASSGGSELSGGAIAGIAVGSVAAATVLAAGAWVLWRRAKQGQQLGDSPAGKGKGKGSPRAKVDLEKGTGSSLTASLVSSVTPSPVPPASSIGTSALFNPFAAGPPSDAAATSAFAGSTLGLGSGAAASASPGTGSGISSRAVSLAAVTPMLRAASGSLTAGSGSVPSSNPKLAAMLEALERKPPSWLISPARLVLEQQGGDGKLVLLGKGSFGRVYRGWLLPPQSSTEGASPTAAAASAAGPTGEEQLPAGTIPVALKVMDEADLGAFLREADIMQRLTSGGSPHVVTLHGACMVDQSLVMVMELMEGGDLRTALSTDTAGALRWGGHGKQVALDIAEGLAHLHATHVTHRDLKSRNILLGPGLRAKVADVGGAAMHSATYLSAGSSHFAGTLAWAAPELLLAEPCTQKIDVYSLGVVLWEIATGETPQRGHVAPPPASDDCPQALADLIADCLKLDAAARPTAAQALERLRAA